MTEKIINRSCTIEKEVHSRCTALTSNVYQKYNGSTTKPSLKRAKKQFSFFLIKNSLLNTDTFYNKIQSVKILLNVFYVLNTIT